MTRPQPLRLGRVEKRHARFRNTPRVSGDSIHSDPCPGQLHLRCALLSLSVAAGGCDSIRVQHAAVCDWSCAEVSALLPNQGQRGLQRRGGHLCSQRLPQQPVEPWATGPPPEQCTFILTESKALSGRKAKQKTIPGVTHHDHDTRGRHCQSAPVL